MGAKMTHKRFLKSLDAAQAKYTTKKNQPDIGLVFL